MPEKQKIKTEWNLKLLYKSHTDPQIEKDVKGIENAYLNFEKKYKNKTDWLKNDKKLAIALNDWDKLTELTSSWKPVIYLHYRQSLDSSDQVIEALFNVLVSRLTKYANKILFFPLEIGKIPLKEQQKFLKSKYLSDFKYFLEVSFKNSRYHLSEAEEKILNLKSMPAHELWTQGQQKLLNKQTVLYKGKELPIPEAINKLPELSTRERRKLYDDIMIVLMNIAHFAESELSAIYTDKKIDDELRGFKFPYSSTILGYENDEKAIIKLVDTVTKSFAVSHKFYKLKAKLLKLPYLECVDKTARIGKVDKKISLEKGVELVKKSFSSIDEKYLKIFESYLENGQIDFYPKKGKRGGAYSSSSINLPGYVFLNHSDNEDGLMTLGHEMGHSFHSELSKSQRPIYENYPISAAEVASTFFENVVFEELLKTMNEKEKIIALHDRIQDNISTVFRQIACFNWENEMHNTLRQKGSLSKEEISNLHNKHMGAYLGPIFKWKELDGYTFVQWPHLRFFFYTYTYCYGELISKAMYKKYKKDKNYLKQIEKFLSSGGSKSPDDIFKDIGIDTSNPNFWKEGLKEIEEDIKKLEKLAKAAKMIK